MWHRCSQPSVNAVRRRSQTPDALDEEWHVEAIFGSPAERGARPRQLAPRGRWHCLANLTGWLGWGSGDCLGGWRRREPPGDGHQDS